MKVPMLDLQAQYEPLMPEIRKALDRVFAEHQYIMGPQVKEFEEKMANYLGIKNAIGCASGTDALVLAIKHWELEQVMKLLLLPSVFLRLLLLSGAIMLLLFLWI